MHLTGRVPLLLLCGLVPVVASPGLSTVWLWVLLVAALTGLDLALAPSPAAVQVTRSGTAPVRLGTSGETVLVAHNRSGRRLRLLIRDAWQPSAGARRNRHRLVLPAGRSARCRTMLHPTRRGELRATRVTVRSTGPLGLAARQAGRSVPGRIRALPSFASRRHLPSRLAALRELDGRSAVRIRGQGTEFDSLRGYVRGDDVRSIDWRATARTREVVVRTWQPERDRRVVLVLDTSRTSAVRAGDVPRLDAAMDAALLLATLAARAGDRVDFLAGDRRVRARAHATGATQVTARLSELMADLQPEIAEADWSTLVGAVHQLGRRRALVVLLTPLEPAAVEESLLPVLPRLVRQHRVVVASVRDRELDELAAGHGDLDAVYAAAAAQHTLRRRRRTRDLLGALGVEVIDADAEALAPQLADHYLSLKARGLL